MQRTGRARVDASAPRAFAVCDTCGFWYNHPDLRWQFQWGGNKLINQHFLVCDTCYDRPAMFLKALTLPPDPRPVLNARPQLGIED